MAPKCKCECSGPCCKRWLKDNLLLIFTLFAMIAGIGLGVGLRYRDPKLTSREIMYLQFPGVLLLRMLKLLIIPLVVSSLISGLASLDAKSSGSMGWKATVYYLCTTIAAVILGIILVVTIQPGVDKSQKIDKTGSSKVVDPGDTILDLIRNVIPDNLIVACFKQTKTESIPIPTMAPPTTTPAMNVTMDMNITSTPTPMKYKSVTRMSDGTNVLGILAFSIAFGVIISRGGSQTRILVSFFDAMNVAIMKLTGLVIWYSPIGVLFLVAAKIVDMDDAMKVLTQLGYYIVTVLAGLAIHGFIILPLVYLILVRKNPITHFVGMLHALLTALATASSAATLPVTFRCMEEKLKVDRHVTRFVLPIGATINMDGTALYEAVASIFIAQVNGIWLDFGQIVIVSITSTLASIGAAGIPQAGLVTMVIVLSAVGLPTEDIRLILAIDWFLDRCRTTINVWGDSIGAAIVARYTKGQLGPSDTEALTEGGEVTEGDSFPEKGNGGLTNENFTKDPSEGSDTHF